MPSFWDCAFNCTSSRCGGAGSIHRTFCVATAFSPSSRSFPLITDMDATRAYFSPALATVSGSASRSTLVAFARTMGTGSLRQGNSSGIGRGGLAANAMAAMALTASARVEVLVECRKGTIAGMQSSG